MLNFSICRTTGVVLGCWSVWRSCWAEMDKRHERISLCLSHNFEDIRGFQWFH